MALHWKGLVKWAARPKFQLRSDLSVVDLQFQTNPGSISQGRTIYLCLTAYTLGETCTLLPRGSSIICTHRHLGHAIAGYVPQRHKRRSPATSAERWHSERSNFPKTSGQKKSFFPWLLVNWSPFPILTTKQRHHCRTGHPSRPTSACNRQSLSHEKKPWRPRFELLPFMDKTRGQG